MKAELTAFLNDAYCFDHVLLRFFKEAEIPLFLSIQAHTGALIGGAMALKFLMRLHVDNSGPLTIYVDQQFEETIEKFLVIMRYNPVDSEAPLFWSKAGFVGWADGIFSDWDFSHSGFQLLHKMAVFIRKDNPEQRIEVAFIRKDPMHAILQLRSSKPLRPPDVQVSWSH
jgi:hypothetical protein